MASGTFAVTTSNPYIVGSLAWWTGTADITGNWTDVYWEWRAWRNNTGYESMGNKNFSITVDGETFLYNSGVMSVTYNSNTLVGNGTKRIYHNSDGTKQINMSVAGSLDGASWAWSSGGGTAVLDTIPRASTPTINGGNWLLLNGQTITINTNRLSSSFVHNAYIDIGSVRVWANTSNFTDSTTFTLSKSYSNQILNAEYLICQVVLDTLSGATLIGSKTLDLGLIVPYDVVPTVGTVTKTEATAANNTGLYVQNVSKLNVSFTPAGAYGSTITKSKIVVDGSTVNAATYNNAPLTHSGSVAVTSSTTDSRGRTTTVNQTVNVVAYALPKLNTFTIIRTDSAGTPNAIGTYVKVTSTGSASHLVNTTERNFVTRVLQYRKVGTSSWTTLYTLTKSTDPLTFTDTGVYGANAILATESYEFRLNITDKFNTTSQQIVVPTASVTMSWAKDGIGVGKMWQQGSIDIRGEIYHNDGVLLPTAVILPYASTTVPAGWLVCDGSAVSRTTYARLFAAIGTLYGAGNGSTTFNLPNLNSRVPVGRQAGVPSVDTLGKTGGSSTHTLTVSEMPSHDHASHTILVNAGGGGTPTGVAGGSYYAFGYGAAYNTTAKGGGGAHNNMQPFVVVNYIIKY